MMYLSNLKQSLSSTVTVVGAIGVGIFASIDSASAFSIGFGDDFSNFNNWNTYGDTLIQDTLNGTYGGASRAYNAGTGNQATLSTACPNAVGTECYAVGDPGSARDDDPSSPIGTYNFSGSDQYDANAETTNGSSLQSALGLDFNALNIPAQAGSTIIEGGSRLPKEGSGMVLDGVISADHEFQISFNWNYLTNDGQDEDYGNSDYGFVVIYETSSDISNRIPIVLGDSDAAAFPTIGATDTSYALSTSGSYISEALPAGDYFVGFGVVDAYGVGRSSALLVDDFLTQEVPFDFTPTTGLGIVAGLIAFKRLRSKQS